MKTKYHLAFTSNISSSQFKIDKRQNSYFFIVLAHIHGGANMLVGRKEEIKTLKAMYEKKDSCFVAIYGRRRVGKTFLVRNCFENKITFEHTGTNSTSKKDQLTAFKNSLEDNGYFIDHEIADWFEAFQHLKRFIENRKEKKKIVFIDELSWIDTKNSKFLIALESFWNGWCSKRKDILLIVCGSSASYILDKIIHNRGGLYNRLSAEINLQPFTLSEVEEYLLANQIHLDHKSIVELYMCLGGVPYYYSFIEKRYSSAQYIKESFENKVPVF